jgi:hypothetical protein
MRHLTQTSNKIRHHTKIINSMLCLYQNKKRHYTEITSKMRHHTEITSKMRHHTEIIS